MKKKFSPAILLSTVVLFFSCSHNMQEWSVVSPNGQIQVTLRSNDGQITYRVSHQGKKDTIIDESPLGITRQDQQFSNHLSFIKMSEHTIDEPFQMASGKRLECINKANESVFEFKNENGAPVEIIFRTYDDGIAYCYRFPEQDTAIYTVISENSGFHIPAEGKAWIAQYETPCSYAPAYEAYYQNAIPIGQASPTQDGWAFPGLFNTRGHWLLITEAAVDSNYYGSHLKQHCENGMYCLTHPISTEAMGIGDTLAHATLPWKTPWRVIIIGDKLPDIVESTIVPALNEPSKIEDNSWIKPGKAAWSWWSEHDKDADFKRQKQYVDFAKEFGLDYVLFDADWQNMSNGGNIEDLVKYTNQKNIGILLWYNSAGPNNKEPYGPRDVMYYPELRNKEFEKLKRWNVKGIKIDFFASDKQIMMKEYWGIMKDAAEAHILVNFHGCTLPRGWNRTYPNLIAMEAVRGCEQYTLDSTYYLVSPYHNTILACLRNVIGPMDYTPMAFTDGIHPHKTTFAHELALPVIFESGIWHLADKPEVYRSLPDAQKKYIQQMPTAWDETKFLKGIPGQYVIFARRHGKTWYVAGINGIQEEREVEIDLTSLKELGDKAIFSTDDNGERKFSTKEFVLDKGQKLKFKMLPYGGFAGSIF